MGHTTDEVYPCFFGPEIAQSMGVVTAPLFLRIDWND